MNILSFHSAEESKMYFAEWKTLKWKLPLRWSDFHKDIAKEPYNCSQQLISNECIDEHKTFCMVFFDNSVMQRTCSSNNFWNGGGGECRLIPSVPSYSANQFFQLWKASGTWLPGYELICWVVLCQRSLYKWGIIKSFRLRILLCCLTDFYLLCVSWLNCWKVCIFQNEVSITKCETWISVALWTIR